MLHAHKIIDLLSRMEGEDNLHFHAVGPGLSGTVDDPKHREHMLAEISSIRIALAVSGKFDLGRFTRADLDTIVQPLAETGRVLREEGLVAMPFENTYLEVNYDNTSHGVLFSRSRVTGVPETGGSGWSEVGVPIERDPVPKGLEGNAWVGTGFFVDKGKWAVDPTQTIFDLGLHCDSGQAVSMLPEGLATDEIRDEANLAALGKTELFLDVALALLSSPDCEVVTAPAPDKLNAKRAKHGRGPVFAHHILKIGGGARQRGEGDGRTHASPRKHWRRGHVRTLRGGLPDEKKIIIGAMIVGGRGFVSKDYEVVQ